MSFNLAARVNAGPMRVRSFRAGDELTPSRLNELVDALNRRRPSVGIAKRIARIPPSPIHSSRHFLTMSDDLPPNRKIWALVNTTDSSSPSSPTSGSLFTGGELQAIQRISLNVKSDQYTWLKFLNPIKGGKYRINLSVQQIPPFAPIPVKMQAVGMLCFRTDTWNTDAMTWNNQPSPDMKRAVGIDWQFAPGSASETSETLSLEYTPNSNDRITGCAVVVRSGPMIDDSSLIFRAIIQSIQDPSEGTKLTVAARKSVTTTRTLYFGEPHGLITGQYVFINNVDTGENAYYNKSESIYGEWPVQITVLNDISISYSMPTSLNEGYKSCFGSVYL